MGSHRGAALTGTPGLRRRPSRPVCGRYVLGNAWPTVPLLAPGGGEPDHDEPSEIILTWIKQMKTS